MAENHQDPIDVLRRKQEHFNGIKSMLDDDDDAPDPGRQASIEKVKNSTTGGRQRLPRDSSNDALPRSVSDTNLVRQDRQPPANFEIDPGPPSSSAGNARLPVSLITRHTFSGSPSKPTGTTAAKADASSRTTGKRKRGEEEAMKVPEAQQIFKDMIFYFFPNTDTNPARKLRIAKAREFGARWQKNYDTSVTHVIVDKAMNYASLMKYLKLDSLHSGTIVVLEGYPAECISFRAIMDPKLPQFKVKGYESKAPVRSAGSGSDVSLQLKPAAKSAMARQPETQTSNKRTTIPPADDSFDDDDGLQMAAVRPMSKAAVTPLATSEEFEKAMQQVRQVQCLPLEDEDADRRPTSSSGLPADPPSPSTATSPEKKGNISYQDKFQCMKPSDGTNTNNPNATTIAVLDEMLHYYDRVGDGWRTRAYRKAISVLRTQPTKVCTKEQALALPQIGERLAAKIEEIVETNGLRRLENTRTDINDQILQAFIGIYGVGFVQASQWVDAGFTTIDELVQKTELTANQKIGIEHYEDFNSRIPRDEVEKLGAIVRKSLLKMDSGFEVIVGGSYRRGAATSGDLDCIITHKDLTTTADYIRQVVLDRLVPKLEAKDFIVADLAATSRADGSKWHGACHLPSPNADKSSKAPWRRIDLLLVPPAELGAALIYFTGNDLFNRSMRLLASTKGFRLNQRGLYRGVIRGKQRERLTEGTVVESRDEKKIFEILGVPWRQAHERNC